MKVALISRSTLFSNPGGDTIQIVNTAKALNELGVTAEVKLCTDAIAYHLYDLLHFFNIIRPADIFRHVIQSKKPYVVSTIFVDYTEYENKVRSGWQGMISLALSADTREYMKVIARRILNGEKIASPSYLLRGHSHTVKYILAHAAMLLPNSESEYRRLVATYKTEKDYRIIPNAVDEKIFRRTGTVRDQKLVLCVARIEGIKNQLNLIRALNGTGLTLHIVGSHSVNHKAYYEQCQKEAQQNIKFSSGMDQQELAALYAKAKVHVLPSWFETTGLSSLEAAAMGCNIVVTDKGDTREYFGDDAFYCDPEDIASIRTAVDRAVAAPAPEAFAERISQHYTWSQAAEKTAAAYKAVIIKQQKA